YRAKCRVMGYNQIGFPQEAVLTKESDEVSIKVLPIPQEDRPATFSGGVGDFTVTARADSKEIRTNQPFSYKVKIEGRGNAKFADLPKIQYPPSFEVYDTKSEMKFYPDGRSFKEFETLLVPRSVGPFEIPSFEISFFVPAKKSFVTRAVNAVSVSVQKGDDKDFIPSVTSLPQ